MEQSIIEFVRGIATEHPYLTYMFFFISAALQILFPPYPGDSVLIFEGYLSSLGYFNPYIIALNAIIATFLSCLLLYHTSYHYGDRIFEAAFIKRYFSRNKINKLTVWFKRYGAAAILISKFVPGIGSLTMIIAGVFKVPRTKVYMSMGAASIIHNSFVVFLGKTAGDNMEFIKSLFRKYNTLIIGFGLLCIICYGVFKLFGKSKLRIND